MDAAVTMATESPRIEAINRMVLIYEKEMLKLCYAYLQDIHLAQEALQESFLKAFTRYDTYRGEASEKTWLAHIVVNTCKDLRRSAWFRHRGPELSPEQVPDIAPPPDEAHMDLINAIVSLPVKSREVILLKYQQGMNKEEIAQVLGISATAVSKRLDKAYARLRTALGEGDDE